MKTLFLLSFAILAPAAATQPFEKGLARAVEEMAKLSEPTAREQRLDAFSRQVREWQRVKSPESAKIYLDLLELALAEIPRGKVKPAECRAARAEFEREFAARTGEEGAAPDGKLLLRVFDLTQPCPEQKN